jgi:hypothetical protein
MKKPILILIISLISVLALAQENGDDIAIGKYYKIDSKILKEMRTLMISLPEGYQAGKDSYPVLFVLYADQVREYFTEAVAVVNRLSGSGDIPPMIIVGVPNRDRYGDLLPVSARDGKKPGAPDFLAFFQEELIPWLKSHYRITDYNIVMGPQAGAPFAIYAMQNGGETINAAVINNPFWPISSAEKSKASLLAMFAEESGPKRFVHVTYKDDMWGNKKLKKYVHHLEKEYSESAPDNFRLEVNYLEGNDDFIVPSGIKRGLKLLFKGYNLINYEGINNLDNLKKYFAELSEKTGCPLEIPYLTLVLFGDHLIKEGKQPEGEAVYFYIIEKFPASVDGLYRMAEIYRKRGEKQKALDFYKKCVERMEDMAPAREWIKKLEAELNK